MSSFYRMIQLSVTNRVTDVSRVGGDGINQSLAFVVCNSLTPVKSSSCKMRSNGERFTLKDLNVTVFIKLKISVSGTDEKITPLFRLKLPYICIACDHFCAGCNAYYAIQQ